MSLVVTAYLDIPSKQNSEFYINHIKRFLKYVKCKVVFFTSEDLIDFFKNIRNENIIYVKTELNDLYTKYDDFFWERHVELDRGHNKTTKELSAIWYNKKEFIKKAINIEKSDIYIWCDAGCIRTDEWIPYLQNFGKNITNNKKLNMQLLRDLPLENVFLTHGSVNIAAAIIYGDTESWLKCSKFYDEILEKFDTNNFPAAMDQYVWGTTILHYPEYFFTVKPIDSPDEWFFFLKFLSI